MNQVLSEFSNVEIDRLVYNLNSLNDVSLEITSNSSLEVSLSNLLRILMGTIGATRGSILLYAPFKLAFESAVVKGFEGALYFRSGREEINQITNYRESFFLEDFEKKFPEFVKRNKLTFDKHKFSLWVTLSVRGRLVGAIVLAD